MSHNGKHNKPAKPNQGNVHAHLMVARGWLTEQLLTDAKHYFDLLLNDLDQAQKSIDLNFYIVALDSLGRDIVDALLKARSRGVAVRLIMDGVGSADSAGFIAKTLTDAGCEVRIFRPLPFSPHLYRWSIMQGNTLQKLMHFLMNINQRNHYKLGIIDQSIVWSGSFNLTAAHLHSDYGGDNWRDYGVRLTDDDTADIEDCFEALWGSATRRPSLSRLHRFRTNLSVPMRSFYNKLLIFRIRYAKERIWICNAYFAPSRSVVNALIDARKKGVDVRLVLPSVSDVALFPAISRSFYPRLLRHDISLYEYPARVLHAKVMLIDEQCWVGSTNLNHRSFYHDLELDIALEKPETIDAVKAELALDMQQSKKLQLKDYPRYSLTMIKARILRVFRYWL